MLNDKRIKSCLYRFDSGAYSCMQFLLVVSHSVGAHTETLQPHEDSSSGEDEDNQSGDNATTSTASKSAAVADAAIPDSCCKVCLVAQREGFALVPC